MSISKNDRRSEISSSVIDGLMPDNSAIIERLAEEEDIPQKIIQHLSSDYIGNGKEDKEDNKFINAQIYIDDENLLKILEMEISLLKLLLKHGFSISHFGKAKRGSLFRKIKLEVNDSKASGSKGIELSELKRSLKSAARLRELNILDDNTDNIAQSVIFLLTKLDKVSMLIDNLLILKITFKNESRVLIRELAKRETVYLESHESLFTNPEMLITDLSELSDDDILADTITIPNN